jgi:hypothetical protein
MSEDAGRLLPGDNKGGGRSCCGPSGSGVLEVGFQLDSLVHTNRPTVDHIYILNSDLRKIRLLPGLPETNYRVSQAVSELEKQPILV